MGGETFDLPGEGEKVAITDPEKGYKGTTRFLVERTVSPFEVKDYRMIGYRIVPVYDSDRVGIEIGGVVLRGETVEAYFKFYSIFHTIVI